MKTFAIIICIIGLVLCLLTVGTADHDAEFHANDMPLEKMIPLAIIGLSLFVGGFLMARHYDRDY